MTSYSKMSFDRHGGEGGRDVNIKLFLITFGMLISDIK